MTDNEILELAEATEQRAADCARWAREARAKSKAAYAAGEEGEGKKWEKIARDWASQAAQLKRDAGVLHAQAGSKPRVGIHGRGSRAARSAPPRKW
jgi:hypothetical protein